MENNAVQPQRKVIIIGAGPAGITCGLELLRRQPGLSVTIIEQTDAIGGISRTVSADGNRMDIGGHRFFSKDQRISNWWQDILPLQGAPSHDDKVLGRKSSLIPGGPDPEAADKVMLVRHRISRIFYGGEFYDYPLSPSVSMLRKLGFARSLSVGFSYLGSCLHKLPETSLENFYINRFGRKLYSMFFEGYTEKVWGRHPRQISADWGAQRVKGLSIGALLKDLIAPKKDAHDTETSLIKEFWYPKFGPGQLWEAAVARFQDAGGTLEFGVRASSLEFAGDGQVAAVVCADAQGQLQRRTCDAVVSSMPLVDLAEAIGGAMPEPARQVAANLPYRDFVTVGLLVDRLAIRNQTDIPALGNIVPDNWIYVQDDEVKLGRLQVFNNWSPYMVEDPENTVWVGLEYFCAEGDAFWNMPEQECVDLARRELVTIGVLDEGTQVRSAHRERVQKAYPAYFDSYCDIDVLRGWLKQLPNLYCVGRNGQHRYNNMDHSMLTGMFAAEAIADGSCTQEDVWSVNTETSYHEKGDAQS